MNSASWLTADPAFQGAEEESLPGSTELGATTFGDIYRCHLPGVYSYLLARCGRQEDAADLAQQVFTQALAALPGYHARGLPIAAWLFRIARNLAVDFRRRRRVTVPWELVPEALHPATPEDVEAAVLRREAVERLGPALARLSTEKRDLLALRFAGGLTVPEMAAVLGRSEAAIRSDLRRILHTLREAYPHD